MTRDKGGFAGRVLHVDLTRGIIHQEPLDWGLAEKFVGGLGLTIKLAYDKRPMEVFPKHLARMGVPKEAMERILSGIGSGDSVKEIKVGRLLKYSHAWFTILGSLGICARGQINRFYSAALCARFYDAVTGIETDLETLREKVDRSWTLLRLANIREGFAREYDALPEQWFKAPGFKDYCTEKPLTIEEAGVMIEDYYDEQGWDRTTGIPTQARLEELGLTECLAP